MANKIYINATSVKNTNSKIPTIKSEVANIKSGINSTRYSIQSNVASRNNISASMSQIYNDIVKIEGSLQELFTTVNSCVNTYVNADDRVKRMAQNVSTWRK